MPRVSIGFGVGPIRVSHGLGGRKRASGPSQAYLDAIDAQEAEREARTASQAESRVYAAAHADGISLDRHQGMKRELLVMAYAGRAAQQYRGQDRKALRCLRDAAARSVRQDATRTPEVLEMLEELYV